MVPVGGSFIFSQKPDLIDKSINFIIKFLRSIQEEQAGVPSLTYLLLSYRWANLLFESLRSKEKSASS